MSDRAFAKEFADMLANHNQDFEILAIEGTKIRLQFSDGWKTTVFLDNAYLRFKNGEAIEAIAAEFANGLRQASDAHLEAETAITVAAIRSEAWLSEMSEKGVFNYFKPIAGDIGIAIAIDTENAISFMLHNQAPEGLEARSALEATAVSNLSQVLHSFSFNRGDGYFRLSAGGDYDASLILHQKTTDKLSETFGGEFNFAIPARDLFLVNANDSEGGANLLKSVTLAFWKDSPYRISKKVYGFRDGDIEVVHP